jgi:hypothetical protein
MRVGQAGVVGQPATTCNKAGKSVTRSIYPH